MTLKVYIASITANTEIRKQVQRVVMVLDGMGVDYEAVDITLPGKEKERDFMRTNGKPREGQTVALPPQIFYDDDFIGDYDAFDNAVEDNQLLYFLRLSAPSTATTQDGPAVSQMNGNSTNEHEVKDDGDEVEVDGGEDVEDEGEGEEGGEEGEEGADDDDGAEEGEKIEGEILADAEEDEEIVEDPEIEDEEGEGEGEEEPETNEAAADAEEEEEVEDVEIEDEEEGDAVALHCVTSLVDCSRVVSRRRYH